MNEFKSGKKAGGIISIFLSIGIFALILYIESDYEIRLKLRFSDLGYDNAMIILYALAFVFLVTGIIDIIVYTVQKKEFYRNQYMNQAPPRYMQQPYMNQQPNQYPNQQTYTNQPQYMNQQQYGQQYPQQYSQPYGQPSYGQPYGQPQQQYHSAPVRHVVCKNCHEQNNANNKFCIYCKYPLDAPSAPQPQETINTWRCKNCGRVNQNYVGTCGCGEVKPR